MEPVDIDEGLRRCGGYRRFHMFIFFCLGCSTFFPLCHQSISIVFIGYQPPHYCTPPSGVPLNESSPLVTSGGVTSYSQCEMYSNASADTNSTVPCQHGWSFGSEGYTSIITEWSLVCSENHRMEVAQVVYEAVSLCGEAFMSFLVDRMGRRPVHIAGCLLASVSGIAVSFSTNYYMFIALRCITAIGVTATVASGCILMMEMFDARRRTFAGIMNELPWVGAMLSLLLLAKYITNWHHLQAAMSALNLVWVMYIWVLPESPIWLLAMGRVREAEGVLARYARLNGLGSLGVRLKVHEGGNRAGVVPEKLGKEKLLQHKDTADEDEPRRAPLAEPEVVESGEVTCSDALVLVRDPVLRKHVLVQVSLWFVNSLVYYCLVLATPSFAGGRFFNFLILALVELPAYCSSYFIIKRYGRRVPLLMYQLFTGLPLMALVFVPQTTPGGTDLSWVVISLAVLAKFGVSSSFGVIILFQPEIFPTHLRGTSGGIVHVAARMGTILAPITSYASKTNIPWVPSVVCAVASIAAGFGVLTLPETNRKPLPITVQDVHDLYKATHKAHAQQKEKTTLEMKPSVNGWNNLD